MLNWRESSIDLLSVEIPTPRLVLRPIDPTFAESIFAEFSPTVTKYMTPPSPASIDEPNAFINSAREGMAEGRELVCAVLLAQNSEFLGVCGLHGHTKYAGPELGIWIKESAHGHGYGLEAVRAMVDWAKKWLRAPCFVYPVDRRNRASCRIAEALGGAVYLEQLSPRSGGREPLDTVVYQIQSSVG